MLSLLSYLLIDSYATQRRIKLYETCLQLKQTNSVMIAVKNIKVSKFLINTLLPLQQQINNSSHLLENNKRKSSLELLN